MYIGEGQDWLDGIGQGWETLRRLSPDDVCTKAKANFDKYNGCYILPFYHQKVSVSPEEKSVFGKILFPYIPTYLAFRELPLVEKVIDELTNTPTVFLIDGNGILHPYGFGLASHVGVKLKISTIGIAKSLLGGTIKNDIVYIDNKKSGFVFFSSNRVKKPIYISPGHKISFKTSLKIVKNLCKYKIPYNIYSIHFTSSRA